MKSLKYYKFYYYKLKVLCLENYCYVNGFLCSDTIKLKKNSYYLLTSNKIFLRKNFVRTFFSLLLRMIDGVNYGFKNVIFVKGKGLRLQIKNRKNKFKIYLKLGYSHKIFFNVPKNFWVFLTERRRTLYLFSLNYNFLQTIIQKIKSYYPIGLYKMRGFFQKYQIIKLKKGKSSRLGSRLY